jgi:hypothetical protein
MSARTIKVFVVGAVAGLGMLSAGLPVSAHHSVALQYDGTLELWRIEFSSANSLYRRGWRPANLPIGSIVTVHGLPARDGSRSVDGEDVTLADGKKLFFGTRPEDR